MGIVDWVFPKMCVGCRAEGKYICDECQKKLVRPEAICPMCCEPSIDGWTHPRCRRSEGMERLIVGLPYKGLVQQCLKKVKYKSSWAIIKFLHELSELPKIEGGIVVGVPMWREKERMRGFNQAETLAKLVAERNKVPYFVLLERIRETKPMYGLTRKARLNNVVGAFRVINNQITNIKQIQNSKNQITKPVIIVDDVWTTGATMKECAKILKQAGVREVWGITLAR